MSLRKDLKKELSHRDEYEAEKYGGADTPERKDPYPPYCDKPDHALRSLYHAPQHKEHWKKEGIIYKYGG